MMWELDTVIWGFPLAYLLHDLEEIFTIEKWMSINRDKIFEIAEKNRLLKRFARSADLTTGQFTFAFLLLFIIVTLSSYFATKRFASSMGLDFFTSLLGVMFLHVFTHVGQTVLLRKYTPGVITAILVMLPYTVYTYHRLLHSGMVNVTSIFITAVVGLMFVIPLLLFAHALGRKFVRS
jgi:Protein of unknown function with HXXEE motif